MSRVKEIARQARQQWWLSLVIVLCVAGAVMTVVTGCGRSTGSAKASVSALASDPALQKAVSKVKVRAQGCLAKANLITHSGRKKFVSCAAGGADTQAVEKCFTTAVGKNGVFSKGERQRTLDDFAVCVAGLKVKVSK